MKQEKLIRLLYELIKNSRRSDRDLAKILGFSQPSVSRLRKIIEKNAILQYTAIPNFSYLGFDLMVFTFYHTKESLQLLREKVESWLKKQSNVVFSSEGQGMGADRVMISVHKDYADFSEFHQKFRRELGPQFESFKTFLVSFRGNEISRLFTFNDLTERATPSFSIVDSQRRKWKRFISPHLLKADPVLDVREGDAIIATYTSVADKMKIFSTFIQEGLENGDKVIYFYPDEESGNIRARLEERGIDVKEYEEDTTLHLMSLTEHFMSNGKLDYEKAAVNGVMEWTEAKRKGYNHVRIIEDVGDFSFVDGQWQEYISHHWLDPRWSDPNVSKWVKYEEPVGIVYKPFIMEITAINVESMKKKQVDELLVALRKGGSVQTRFFDLLEHVDAFAKLIGLDHEQLVGRKILLEFDPTSDYETIVEDFAREHMANVEPICVFTSAISPLHKCLAKHKAIKLFSMSTSTSTIQSISENEVLMPADNIDLIRDSINNVTKTYSKTNLSVVFDGLSDLLSSLNSERAFAFLRQALHTLSSERTTALFLLNTGAHETEVVSRLRNLFSNQLVYSKSGLEIVKTS